MLSSWQLCHCTMHVKNFIMTFLNLKPLLLVDCKHNAEISHPLCHRWDTMQLMFLKTNGVKNKNDLRGKLGTYTYIFWIYIASAIMVDLQSPITCCNLSKVTKKILWNWALFKRKTWIPLNLIDKIELYCRIFYDNICKCLIFWTHSLSGVTHTATMSKYTLLESCSKSLSCNVLTFQFVQERA